MKSQSLFFNQIIPFQSKLRRHNFDLIIITQITTDTAFVR